MCSHFGVKTLPKPEGTAGRAFSVFIEPLRFAYFFLIAVGVPWIYEVFRRA